MSYEDRIRSDRTEMSKSFAKLADFLLDSYIEASFMTASELAHALNLDAATVVRFSQSLGYKGFPQLQREIRQKVKGDLLIRPVEAEVTNSVPGVAANTLRELANDLEQTTITLNTDALTNLVETIGQSKRIIVLADPPAQPAAYNLLYFLEQGGFNIFIARYGAIDLARTIHTATSQDLMLVMDVAGYSPYIDNALREAKEKGIPTAAIVAAASLPSARSANIVIAAQSRTSVASGTVVISALIAVLAEALRWRFTERFVGVEQAIAELSERIQQISE